MKIEIEKLRRELADALAEYPFNDTNEAAALGVPRPLLDDADEFTALETPFTFARNSAKGRTAKNCMEIQEEISSSCETSDSENPYYGDEIRMNVDLFVNNKQIVDDSTVVLGRNGKYGLVGRNGIGKTTLLRAIRKRKFGIPKGLGIHMLRQDYVSDERVVDFVGADAGAVLQALGFTRERQAATLRSLSGGWRMRAQLAKAIHLNPDLLLLDEPTNFLDIEGINYLEAKMADLKTVLVVSHDRNFLDNTVDAILELSECKITATKGNYSQFEARRAEAKEAQRRDYENDRAQRAHLQSFIDRFRSNARRAPQAQSRLKLLEKMPVVAPPKEAPRMRFRFDGEAPRGVLVEMSACAFRYGDGREVFTDVSLRVEGRARIVVVGSNGMGKSTLLQLLCGALAPTGGRVTRNGVRAGYFAQHHVDHLDHSVGTLALMLRRHDEETSRAALAGFGLHVNNQAVATLSGGQKSRLAFAQLSLERPNLLVLDEPTNHLDLETIEALGEALRDFPGAVICVSHDISFIQRVFDEVYVCEGGVLRRFQGSPMDYKAMLKSSKGI